MMTHEPIASIYFNEKELATRWSITTKTLQRWRWQGGGLPYIKIGGNVRYALTDIEEYEKLNRFFSTSERPPLSDK